MLAKIKDSKAFKATSVATVSSLVAAMAGITSFAADPESADAAIQSALSTAFATLQSNLLTYIGIALPSALGVIAIVFAIKFGVRFFLSLIPKR